MGFFDDDINEDFEDDYEENMGRDPEKDSKIVLGFCKACDEKRRFDATIDDFEAIIYNLFKQYTIFNKQESRHYLVKAIDASIVQYPADKQLRLWRLRYLINQKQFREALKYYESMLLKFGPFAELYEDMAFACYEFDIPGQNAEYYAKLAISYEPTSEMYILRTKICLDRADVDGAVKQFTEAVEIDKTVFYTLDMITLYRHQNMIDDPLLSYERQNLNDADNHKKMPDFSVDIRFLSDLSDTFPLNFDVWNVLGRIYLILGDYQKAIESYQFAVSIEQNPLAYASMSQAYFELHDYEKVIEYCSLINENSDSISANALLGSAKRAQGKYSEALSVLSKVDETDFAYPMVLPEIVDTLIDCGRPEDIPAFFDKYFEKSNLSIQKVMLLLDIFLDIKRIEPFKLLCKAAREFFATDSLYSGWLAIISVDYNLQDEYLPDDIMTDLRENSEDPFLERNIPYHLAIVAMLKNNPDFAQTCLEYALIVNEEGIKTEFFDIDIQKMYAQFPNIFDIVYKYL